MELTVKVIPGAKRNEFKQDGDTFKVYLSAPAVDGKANKALIGFLADVYQVRERQIQITKGLKSRVKTIIIENI